MLNLVIIIIKICTYSLNLIDFVIFFFLSYLQIDIFECYNTQTYSEYSFFSDNVQYYDEFKREISYLGVQKSMYNFMVAYCTVWYSLIFLTPFSSNAGFDWLLQAFHEDSIDESLLLDLTPEQIFHLTVNRCLRGWHVEVDYNFINLINWSNKLVQEPIGKIFIWYFVGFFFLQSISFFEINIFYSLLSFVIDFNSLNPFDIEFFIFRYFFTSSEHIYMFLYFFMVLVISLAFIGQKPIYMHKAKFLFKNLNLKTLKKRVPHKETEYVFNTNVHRIFFSLLFGFFFLINYLNLLISEILYQFSFHIIFILYFLILFLLYYSLVFGYLTLYFIRFEYIILMLSCVFSILLFILCQDFCVLYISLELLSISSVILALKNRYSIFALEAGLKYFLINGFASILLLTGFLIIYFHTGSLNFFYIKILFLTENHIFFVAGFTLVLLGLLLKLGVFPFHAWLVDIYEGTSTFITSFFSIFIKFGLIILLLRLNFLIGLSLENIWRYLFIFFGFTSSFIGALYAIKQVKLKKLWAYSSINHTGFLLITLGCTSLIGLWAFCLYFISYTIVNLAFWSLLLAFKTTKRSVSPYLTDFRGLYYINPILAVSLSFLFFGFLGLPPFAGFFSKYLIIAALIKNVAFFSALLLLVCSFIAVFYYIQLIKLLFFDTFQSNNCIKTKTTGMYCYVILSCCIFLNISFLTIPNFWLEFCLIISEIILRS